MMTYGEDIGARFDEPAASVHMTQPELAARWRISVRTLQRWHADGYGPPQLRIGGRTLYRVGDVLAHEAAHLTDPTD